MTLAARHGLHLISFSFWGPGMVECWRRSTVLRYPAGQPQVLRAARYIYKCPIWPALVLLLHFPFSLLQQSSSYYLPALQVNTHIIPLITYTMASSDPPFLMLASPVSPPHSDDMDTSLEVPLEAPLEAPSGSPQDRLPNGVYVPMLAFFTPDDEIDVPTTQKHTARLLAAGVTGLVVHGSNGEAVHLSRKERRVVIEAVADTVRHEVDSHNPVPIVAGCSASSEKETVELCYEAREAGATHALILAPGYYAGILNKDMIVEYFHNVATQSPIPILVYNFPAAANGVDLDSDTILRIAAHPAVVGVKLTCGNTGKLARLVVDAPKVRGGVDDFLVTGGSADFILQGLVVGGHGTISGFANLAPRACVKIGELFEEGKFDDARALQHEVARADWLAIRYGFVGVKAAMPYFWGEGDRSATEPRLPFRALDQEGVSVQEIQDGMATVLQIERALAASALAA
ncbi:hypothetical protein QBC44DRAFT_325645 [Cladorrhinum sp. PSN332]|nr:hypothetical protein QBC44DRAFT_325645 [Cladorrhinum sp. PSN332]